MKISEQFYEYAYIFLADQNAVGSIAEESEYQRLIERGCRTKYELLPVK